MVRIKAGTKIYSNSAGELDVNDPPQLLGTIGQAPASVLPLKATPGKLAQRGF